MSLFLSKISHFFTKMKDIVITYIVYVLPAAFTWFYRTKIKKLISTHPIHDGQIVNLYMHQHGDSDEETVAVLLVHGIYGHPSTLLHFADLAIEVTKGPVFSIHIKYNEKYPEVHRQELKLALDEIERMVKKNKGKLKGMIMVGHSLGAIESVYRAFVDKDKRILSVISIAGRLKVVPSTHRYCDEHLKPTIDTVYNAIQKKPDLPLYQIAAEQDWNAPLEATVVRPHVDVYHIVNDTGHFNILYHNDTRKLFHHYLTKSLKTNES